MRRSGGVVVAIGVVLVVAFTLSAVAAAVIALLFDWSFSGSFRLAALVTAGLAPLSVSAGQAQLMDVGRDVLIGKIQRAPGDRDPDVSMTPIGTLLFVSLPLAAVAFLV